MRGFPLNSSTTILDVGGCPSYWQYRQIPAQITVLNQPSWVPPDDLRGCKVLRGDGTKLDIPDASYDIAHSNSVIEHVSTWERQIAFAREIRRIGNGVWVQTPAKCFPVECHTLDPLFHRLPNNLRRRVLRNGTLWGWLNRPTLAEIDDFLATTRLLTYAEMQELFPDCTIIVERFAGISKSYIAYRPMLPTRQPEKNAATLVETATA
ncbi:MAG TPA: methyltransferase domain-containing protein [Verrucomicrobiae bacterium]